MVIRKTGNKVLNLPVEKIKYLLDEGMRQIDVATMFDVSQGTISRISRTPGKANQKSATKTHVCSCCNQRPIAKGNRFLCATCYAGETMEEHIAWA